MKIGLTTLVTSVTATIILALTAQSQAGDNQRSSRPTQACSGVLVFDEDEGYRLEPNPNSKSLLCDAIIESPEIKQVLDKCTIGKQCYIKGNFGGHGVFYWAEIKLVKAL
jgi:hypothetical protein